MPNFNKDTLIKSLSKSIKEYANIKADRTKIQADMIANELKARNNWFWRRKELDYQTPYQRKLAAKYNEQQAGNIPGPAQVVMGQGGYREVLRTPEEQIYYAALRRQKQGSADERDLAIIGNYEAQLMGLPSPAARQQSLLDEARQENERLKNEAMEAGYDISNLSLPADINEQNQVLRNAIANMNRMQLSEKEKREGWQLQSTEDGLYRVNKITGEYEKVGDIEPRRTSILSPEEISERTRAEREVGREQDIVDLFEGTAKKAVYLEKNKFNDKEKEQVESYLLEKYNELRKKHGLPELGFVKVKAGMWGSIGDYWKLQEKEPENLLIENNQETQPLSDIAPELAERGITEEDIQYTMRKHGLSREEVLERIR